MEKTISVECGNYSTDYTVDFTVIESDEIIDSFFDHIINSFMIKNDFILMRNRKQIANVDDLWESDDKLTVNFDEAKIILSCYPSINNIYKFKLFNFFTTDIIHKKNKKHIGVLTNSEIFCGWLIHPGNSWIRSFVESHIIDDSDELFFTYESNRYNRQRVNTDNVEKIFFMKRSLDISKDKVRELSNFFTYRKTKLVSNTKDKDSFNKISYSN